MRQGAATSNLTAFTIWLWPINRLIGNEFSPRWKPPTPTWSFFLCTFHTCNVRFWLISHAKVLCWPSVRVYFSHFISNAKKFQHTLTPISDFELHNLLYIPGFLSSTMPHLHEKMGYLYWLSFSFNQSPTSQIQCSGIKLREEEMND